MPSPGAASENVVVSCASFHGALSVSLYVKHQTRPPPPGHVSFSVFHMLQCTGQRAQWSVMVTQTMHAACRPTARPLYRGCCVSYDIAT